MFLSSLKPWFMCFFPPFDFNSTTAREPLFVFSTISPVIHVIFIKSALSLVYWVDPHLPGLLLHSMFLLNLRSPPKFPEVILPEEMFLDLARTLRFEINEAFATFRYVASGRDLKQFLLVISETLKIFALLTLPLHFSPLTSSLRLFSAYGSFPSSEAGSIS